MSRSSEPLPDTSPLPPRRPWLTPFPELTRDMAQRYLLLAALIVLLTLIILPKGGLIPVHYQPGDIAPRNVKAPRDLLVQDQELTEQKRVEAAETTLPVYDYDPHLGGEQADRLLAGLRLLRGRLASGGTVDERLRQEIEQHFGGVPTPRQLKALRDFPLDEGTLRTLRAALLLPYDEGMIVSNGELFQADRARGITVHNIRLKSDETLAPSSRVMAVAELPEAVRRAFSPPRPLSGEQRELLSGFLLKGLRPNLTFNRTMTEESRAGAVVRVKPVLSEIKRGEMVVREGDRVTAEQIKKLKALAAIGNDTNTWHMAAGLMIVIGMLFYVCHRFARKNIRKYRLTRRDVLLLVTIFGVQFVLLKIAIFIAGALDGAVLQLDAASYYYLFPFAIGAMAIRIILNSEIALIFSVVSALLTAILFGNNLFFAIYVLIGSLTGAHWVRHCKERSVIYRAGVRLAVANLILVVGLQLLIGRPFDVLVLYRVLFAFGSGLIAAGLVNAVVPLLEGLFKYTTDMKLLELANMDNPVLRELMIQAPGTYHHSVVVGNLAEAAAEAINANPLLARVAAYYHDIGKAKKASYFIENQRDQENRHDRLTPSMSALILMSHVKEGVEIAREHQLGNTLIDIIQQHHGTALMKFFFEKAKATQAPEAPSVEEKDYRYPGPKPQTREAALIMLADAVEAASRTLHDPTAARIQGMVQKIVNNIFIDGQLDECELTLKDLHLIAKSFNRVLAGIYHQRIDYPEPAYKERDKDGNKRKPSEHPDREPATETKNRETKSTSGGPDDLKRLGMS